MHKRASKPESEIVFKAIIDEIDLAPLQTNARVRLALVRAVMASKPEPESLNDVLLAQPSVRCACETFSHMKPLKFILTFPKMFCKLLCYFDLLSGHG